MDALVKTALDKVNEAVGNVNWKAFADLNKNGGYAESIENPLDPSIRRAVNSVDALKFRLKALYLL